MIKYIFYLKFRPVSTEDDDMSRPSFLLDIGAGSGLSGEILTEEGHEWVGLDISGGMLGKIYIFLQRVDLLSNTS